MVWTGPGGTVSKSDVEAAAGLGRVPEHANRVPIKGVRKATATNVAESIAKHVHVTEFNTIDVSATKALVEVLRARREFAGVVTVAWTAADGGPEREADLGLPAARAVWVDVDDAAAGE